MTFQDILGNELIRDQLKNAIHTRRLQHAYMLTGEKGMGKKSMVQAFLLELFCTSPAADGAPCLGCPACKKILSGNHPDVTWVTHEKPASISVDDIRTQITETVDIRPYEGGFRVYVVPDADKMTVQAQNALLKTLEEPPEYVIIFLLANDEKNLLETVRSRVVREKMKPLTDGMIFAYMREHLRAEDEKAKICVAFARGNLGRAMELYRSETFSEWYQRLMKIIRGIRGMNNADILIEIGKLRNECPDLMEALDLLELWYRDLIMFMITRDLNGLALAGEQKTLMETASVSSYTKVQSIMESIETCRKRLQANVNPELSLELLLLSMKEI
ncbi:MAG: DNA polymerase III subunit [Lachnospiraceae bacterium]|nr:DNA polymerase III subunit [Lachnospiraceae bacterium]